MTDPALPVEPLAVAPRATVVVPGSKSITNRALVAAALARPDEAQRTSVLHGALLADDTEAMLGCLAALGVGLEVDRPTGRIEVRGLGVAPRRDGPAVRLPSGPVDLDARLSGTTSRFLLPVLALGPGPYRLDGAAPLRARPMADGLAAVEALGATVEAEGAAGHLPVVVRGGATPPPTPGSAHALRVVVRGDASSQFLSGLLLAGPALPGGLGIDVEGELVSEPYVAMTEAVMCAFGGEVNQPVPGHRLVRPTGYRAAELQVEPDASAASYFFAAAALFPGSRVRIEGLGTASLQGDLAFVDVLEQMGARVTREAHATTVEGTGTLHGGTFDLGDLSDTAQTLAAVAVFAEAPTEVTGIGFIRAKETDRIAAVVAELRRAGITADETPDGFTVEPGRPHAARIATYDDHRMAMSFALLGLKVAGIEIEDPGCVAKTFPTYFEVLGSLRSPGAPASAPTPPPGR
jgi:3-phosphoshikimate 1-carboxyvinyltransferase